MKKVNFGIALLVFVIVFLSLFYTKVSKNLLTINKKLEEINSKLDHLDDDLHELEKM